MTTKHEIQDTIGGISPEEARAIGDAAHEPGPIPEGMLYCVQCHDAEGKACGEPSEPMTHADAIAECQALNASERDGGKAVGGDWYGVTHAPVEAK